MNLSNAIMQVERWARKKESGGGLREQVGGAEEPMEEIKRES